MSRVDDDEQLEIKEIRAWADSFRAFYCTPENAEVFERDRERAHRMVRYLLAQLKDGGAASELIAVWRENQCGDKECEAVRLEAALLLLKGHESDHRYYARVVTIGKQEVEARATAPTESSERCGECVKCGHSGWLDVRGFCHQVVGAEVIDPRECGCHCIFPATEQAEEHDSCSHWREGDSDNCVWCGDNLGPTTEADVAAPATPVAQPEDDPREPSLADLAIQAADYLAKLDDEQAGYISFALRSRVAGSTTSPSTAAQEAAGEIADHFNENTLWHVGEPTVAIMVAIISKHCCGGREAEISFDDHMLRKIEERQVIGTERGTPVVELAEWERDGLCQKARRFQGLVHEVSRLNSEVERLRFDLGQAHGWIADVEERERAVCPEDVGFDEYIRTLQTQLTAALQQLQGEGGKDAN